MAAMQKFSLKQRLAVWLLPPLAALLFRLLAWSWRDLEMGESGLSGKRPQGDARIYVTWHESVLAMLGAYRGQAVHPFASQSFDGELVSRLARQMGYPPLARGSSSKGGATGLLEMRAFLDAGEHVYITVDGPRGPRREAKEGSLKLAQLSGKSLVPIACAAQPAWRLRSWDRMIIPRPFSRCVYFFGPEMKVPSDAASLEPFVKALGEAINRCHDEAEKQVLELVS